MVVYIFRVTKIAILKKDDVKVIFFRVDRAWKESAHIKD